MPAKKALKLKLTLLQMGKTMYRMLVVKLTQQMTSARPEPRVGENTGTAHNMDVIQILHEIRNDFSTKIDVVLEAIQDVNRDVQAGLLGTHG